MRSSPGGITPTIDAVLPPMRTARFRMFGSPPNRVCHRRWLIIATLIPGAAPNAWVFPCITADVPSSCGVKPRPRAGLTASTGKGSSRRSAVNTRSGTSPPARLRLPRSKAAMDENARAPRRSAYSAGESASTYAVSDDTFGNVAPIVTSVSGSG